MIVASNGMLTGGRVVGHLRHLIDDPARDHPVRRLPGRGDARRAPPGRRDDGQARRPGPRRSAARSARSAASPPTPTRASCSTGWAASRRASGRAIPAIPRRGLPRPRRPGGPDRARAEGPGARLRDARPALARAGDARLTRETVANGAPRCESAPVVRSQTLHGTSVPSNVGLGLIRGEIGQIDARSGLSQPGIATSWGRGATYPGGPTLPGPRAARDTRVPHRAPPGPSGGTREAIGFPGPTIGRPFRRPPGPWTHGRRAALGRSAVHGHAARDPRDDRVLDPLFRAVVPALAVLREDARGGLQRVRHLQPHVPAGLLRRPGRGVLGAAQRRDRCGTCSVERIVEITGPGRVGLRQHADLPRPDEVRRRAGQVRADHRRGRRHRQRPGPAAGRGRTAGGWRSPTRDAGLWARGVAIHSGMDVKVREPEVYPVQVQGPKSKDTLRDALRARKSLDIKYYWTLTTEVDGIPVVISRTGWTGEVGYEVYLRDPSRGARALGPDHGGRQAARHPPDRPVRGAPHRGRHLQLRLGHHDRRHPVPRHGPRASRRAAGGRLHRQGGTRGDPRQRRRSQARRHRDRRRRPAVRALAQVPRVPRRRRTSGP